MTCVRNFKEWNSCVFNPGLWTRFRLNFHIAPKSSEHFSQPRVAKWKDLACSPGTIRSVFGFPYSTDDTNPFSTPINLHDSNLPSAKHRSPLLHISGSSFVMLPRRPVAIWSHFCVTLTTVIYPPLVSICHKWSFRLWALSRPGIRHGPQMMLTD